MKKHQAVFESLLNQVSLNAESTSILTYDDTQEWQAGVLVSFLQYGLLRKKAKAKSLTCIACEYRCVQPIVFSEDKQRAFIVCDVPEKQADMGRVFVSNDRLQQWQTSLIDVAKTIHKLMCFDTEIKDNSTGQTLQLGMLNGKHGRHWLILNKANFELELNNAEVAINDFLYFESDILCFDQHWLNTQLKQKPRSTGKRYQSSTDNREIGKANTQAMYQDWNDEYVKLSKTNPDKRDSWIAGQIAKRPIGKGRSIDTIRKNMK